MEEATKFTHVWLKNCAGRVVNVEGNIKMNIRKISHEVVRFACGDRGELTSVVPLERFHLNPWTQN